MCLSLRRHESEILLSLGRSRRRFSRIVWKESRPLSGWTYRSAPYAVDMRVSCSSAEGCVPPRDDHLRSQVIDPSTHRLATAHKLCTYVGDSQRSSQPSKSRIRRQRTYRPGIMKGRTTHPGHASATCSSARFSTTPDPDTSSEKWQERGVLGTIHFLCNPPGWSCP